MLDVLSGGRLVAGMPVGTPMDGALCYGLPPLEQRERYAEAHELIIKAWTSDEMFAWNGKYFQLPCVNVWPRPIQQPHPPIWVPGTGSTSTWDFVAANDYGYMVLTAFSGRLGHHRLDSPGRGLLGPGRGARPRPEPVPGRGRADPARRRVDGPDRARLLRAHPLLLQRCDPHRARAPEPARIHRLRRPRPCVHAGGQAGPDRRRARHVPLRRLDVQGLRRQRHRRRRHTRRGRARRSRATPGT